jgi:hypothetical protein
MAVYPSEHGEEYSYVVDKCWTVAREVDDKTVEVRTRRGKVHRLSRDDPHFRRARILERIFHASRFAGLHATA